MPRAEASVTTISWRDVCASRLASLFSSAPFFHGSSRCASSITRPSSSGKSTAAAGPTKAQNSASIASKRRMAWLLVRGAALELDLRRTLGLFGDGEGLHRLVAFIERARPDHARKGLELGIVCLHRPDVVAPSDRDAVFGAFELRLQRQEGRVR